MVTASGTTLNIPFVTFTTCEHISYYSHLETFNVKRLKSAVKRMLASEASLWGRCPRNVRQTV